ncbi:MAG: protein kinase family protein [Planctomycetota bacterium]|jgi:hypothetical protein
MERELSSFLDDNRGCIVIRKDTEKLILKVPATVSGGPTLFVKIYTFSQFHTRLRNFLGGRKSGIKDFRTCKKLEGLGVPVPTPVGACADSFPAGFARRSLFATQWIADAVSVRDLILAQVSQQESPSKIVVPKKREYPAEGVITTDKFFFKPEEINNFNFCLGTFVAGIHNRGVYTNDLNTGNILVQMPINSEPRFLLIDYEGVSFKTRVAKEKCLANLAQIAAFISQVDECAVRNLCHGYSAINQRFDLEDVTEIVEARSQLLQELWLKRLNTRFEEIGRKLQQSK